MTSTSKARDGALHKLKELYRFMTENNLETLELDEAGYHVRLVRRSLAPAPGPIVPIMVGGGLPAAPSGSAPAVPAAVAPQPSALQPGAVAIKSAMMGIFYRAASPSSPPFAKENDQVKPGQILCMIEAMKVFNEIKAEFACTVLKVLVENGKPVKAGQDLFIVQRS